jgi:cell division protein FtsI/penicillin-binding protein 2
MNSIEPRNDTLEESFEIIFQYVCPCIIYIGLYFTLSSFFVITHFLVILQFTFFLSLKKNKKTKNIIKKYNSEKRMSECSENGQELVEEVQKYKD